MSTVSSVHQRTCLISHTSAYVGAIRRSVTGPLELSLLLREKCCSGAIARFSDNSSLR